MNKPLAVHKNACADECIKENDFQISKRAHSTDIQQTVFRLKLPLFFACLPARLDASRPRIKLEAGNSLPHLKVVLQVPQSCVVGLQRYRHTGGMHLLLQLHARTSSSHPPRMILRIREHGQRTKGKSEWKDDVWKKSKRTDKQTLLRLLRNRS